MTNNLPLLSVLAHRFIFCPVIFFLFLLVMSSLQK
jgi:hypothetical protein